MNRTDICSYYERRYGPEGMSALPDDPSRHRAWIGSLLERARPGAVMLEYGCGVGYVCSLFVDLGTAQAVMNRLSLGVTDQFVIETGSAR